MSMLSKTDVNPVENLLQNSQKPDFLSIWEPKMTRKFGPLGPIFYIPPKIAVTSLSIKFDVNLEEIFLENR